MLLRMLLFWSELNLRLLAACNGSERHLSTIGIIVEKNVIKLIQHIPNTIHIIRRLQEFVD